MEVGRVKKGWLSKQGGSSKGWKRRWCVFDNNALFYYKSQESELTKDYAGAIFAEDMRVVVVDEAESRKNPKFAHCFTIETRDRNWMMCADSAEDMEEWMEFLKQVYEEEAPPSLEGNVLYATVECFATSGVRINGSVESSILAKLSEGATNKQKRKDMRGWSCDKFVTVIAVMTTFAEHGWTLFTSYKSQAMQGDKLVPVTMIVFTRAARGQTTA